MFELCHGEKTSKEIQTLYFGWIDSTLKKFPNGRLAQRLSPRRKYNHWTALNISHCEDLDHRGLMTDAERAALNNTVEDE